MAKSVAPVKRTFVTLIMPAIALLAIAACTQLERAEVYNDTSGLIVVRLKAAERDGRDVGDVLVTLPPGKSKVFRGARLRSDRLPITVGRCTYVYLLSGEDLWEIRDKHGLIFPIEIKLRRDLKLVVPGLPETGALGFPRAASTKVCRE